MREIKFQAWDLDAEQMYNWESIRQLFHEHLDHPRVKVRQYTGLKDKNDREIYEKDISEESYINPMTGKKVIDRYVIEWESGILKMKHIDNPKGADRYLWMRFNEVEIIGDVYRNPELLEAAE